MGLIISAGSNLDSWRWAYPVLSPFLVTDAKNAAGNRLIKQAPLEIEPEYVPSRRARMSVG